MDEQQWTAYLAVLARAEPSLPRACVGCWYEQHPTGLAFPGDQVSSTLCPQHRRLLPPARQAPHTLLLREELA